MKMKRIFEITICLGVSFFGIKASAQTANQPAIYQFSAREAVDYALKNAIQVKNALIDVELQRQTNKEVTAAALPQITGSASATYNPNVAVQSFPNFIAQGTYGVLEANKVKDGNGSPIVAPSDFGFHAPFSNIRR